MKMTLINQYERRAGLSHNLTVLSMGDLWGLWIQIPQDTGVLIGPLLHHGLAGCDCDFIDWLSSLFWPRQGASKYH